ARVTLRGEDRLDALLGDEVLGADRVPEDVAVERGRLAQRGDGDADMVQATRVDAARHARRGWYSPKTPRRSVQISPSVTPARTAAMIAGTRFASLRARFTSSARAFDAAARSRFARNARTRST